MPNKFLKTLVIMNMSMLGGCNKPENKNFNQAGYSGTFGILDNEIRPQLLKCGVDQSEFERLLALPQKKFDQDLRGGWRAVSYKEGCQNAAAEIIKAYILYSEPFPSKKISILRWHAGQSKASAGHYVEAISLFTGTYKPDGLHAETWNLYVDATIAFLQEDLSALTQARDRLIKIPVTDEEKESRRKFLADNPNVSMPDGFVDNPNNLSPVQSLIRCFGQPYAVAYGNCKTN